MRNAKKKAIAEKLAKATHTSSKAAFKSIMFLKIIFNKNPEMCEKISDNLELDEEEIKWLKA